jgi:hypothetical protein
MVVVGILAVPSLVFSAMSSTNYYLYADSVDFGGGVGTSTNYSLQESMGGYAVGISTSTNFEVRAGFQSAEIGSLSLSLGGISLLNLGSLTNAGDVASGNVVATVGTNSGTGYTLSVTGVSGTSLADVLDTAVDGAGGIEEYGLAVSGSHADYAIDKAIVNNLVLSSVAAPVSSDNTTLTFKVVRSATSAVATYSQLITLTAAANI